MTLARGKPFHRHGELLTPGYNVDAVDVAAGMEEAGRAGYGDSESQMVVAYALARWARGEEEGAIRSFLSGGVDLTSAYRILAAAVLDEGQVAVATLKGELRP